MINCMDYEKNQFKKITAAGWGFSSIKSCQSFNTGIHKFTVKSLNLNTIMIGVCTADNSLKTNYVGAFDKTWSYYMNNG